MTTTTGQRGVRGAAGGHVVVGLGRTGVSCVRHLRARGVAVHAMDSRVQPPGLAALGGQADAVGLTLGRFDEQRLRSAERIANEKASHGV